MKYRLIICLLLLSLHNIFAGKSRTKDIENTTFVTISGSSTINQFQLINNNVTIKPGNLATKNNCYFIEIPVHDFESENRKITSDFRELVKAEYYPTISIVIRSDELKPDNHKISHINGTVTLAGQDHQTRIAYTALPTTQKKLRIQGEATLKLTNFNLQPPTKLFGAIQVHNLIFVNFVLYVESH
ncbi:MAG: hypothetical protein K9G70_08085 [Prolixibacteraceae bacterium]|nr:hypothetical protein [Prolixibacteraceae bacterium]